MNTRIESMIALWTPELTTWASEIVTVTVLTAALVLDIGVLCQQTALLQLHDIALQLWGAGR